MDLLFSLSIGMLVIVVFLITSIFGVVAYYFVNKKRILSGEFYKINKVTSPPEPYENQEEAKKAIIKENIKQLIAFGVYFVIAIVMLNLFFGRIQYGPNLPYLVSLAAIGIPFLICFCLIMTKIETQRYRMIATGISEKQANATVRKSIIYLPLVLLVIIKLSIKLASVINQ